jgi:hypothetical protein
LKKRTKKLLHIGTRLFQHRGLMSKSFLLLFFKKEVLTFFLTLANIQEISGPTLSVQSHGGAEPAIPTAA